MAQPDKSQLHVNQPLTQISIAYMQDVTNFIADRVFPMIPSEKQSDIYREYPRDWWWRTEAAVRAPGAPSAGSGYAISSTQTYYCWPYALHHDIPDINRAAADADIDLDRNGTLLITQQMLIKRDRVFVDNHFVTGKWTGSSGSTDITGVDGSTGIGNNSVLQWSDVSSTPIEDIDMAKLAIAERTGGRIPKKAIFGPHVIRFLRNHPDIIDRIKYTREGIVDIELLASLFGLDEILVPYAVQSLIPEGTTEVGTRGFMYGRNVWLGFVNDNPSPLTPSAGYTFAWTGLTGGPASMGMQIKKYHIDELGVDRIEAEMAFDIKQICADCGVFFSGIVST